MLSVSVDINIGNVPRFLARKRLFDREVFWVYLDAFCAAEPVRLREFIESFSDIRRIAARHPVHDIADRSGIAGGIDPLRDIALAQVEVAEAVEQVGSRKSPAIDGVGRASLADGSAERHA